MPNIAWEFYVDGNRFLGTGQLTLPSFEHQTVEMKGAGIDGAVDVVIPNSDSKMEMSITLNDVDDKNADALCEEKVISISAYNVSEKYDRATGGFVQDQQIVEADVRVKTNNHGSFNPGELIGVEQTLICYKYKRTINGKVITHKSPFDRINIVNGNDQNANIRSLLGL